MEPILYVMAILGCGESDASCRELRVEQAGYRSESACVAATGDALARHADLAYPNVVAQCRTAAARATLLRGSDVLRPERRRPARNAPLRIAAGVAPRLSR